MKANPMCLCWGSSNWSRGAEVNPSSSVDVFHGWSLSMSYIAEQLFLWGCWVLFTCVCICRVCVYECVCALCAGTECTVNRTWPISCRMQAEQAWWWRRARRISGLVKGCLNLLISSSGNMKLGNGEFVDAIPKKKKKRTAQFSNTRVQIYTESQNKAD